MTILYTEIYIEWSNSIITSDFFGGKGGVGRDLIGKHGLETFGCPRILDFGGF